MADRLVSRLGLQACAVLVALSAGQSVARAADRQTPPVGTLPVSGEPIAKSLPRRHEGTRLHWDPTFNRMDLPEMVVTGAAAFVALATNIASPRNTGWRGGILFDDQVRKALRLSTLDARLDVRGVTDVGLALIATFPVLVDSVIVAYWYRGSDDVAMQMVLIDAEAFAIAGAIQGASNYFAGRERPYGQDCGTQVPNSSVDCTFDTRYRSFFSGHSAISFTAASLTCAHHMTLGLFESAADPITCATGMVAAATIGALRIVGDAHYLSDVVVGAAVGTLVGLGVPLLHHYKRSAPDRTAEGLRVRMVPTLTGVELVGTF